MTTPINLLDLDPDKEINIRKWVLRRNPDGLIRTIDYGSKWGAPSFINYYFLDGGNLDCDCNREGAFEAERDYDYEHECGETRYTTLAVIDATGRHLIGRAL